MKLIEAEGKQLLKEAGIAIPDGVLLSLDVTSWPEETAWEGPRYCKAQVLRGRRGTSGLVQRVAASSEAGQAFERIRSALGGVPSSGIYCEREVEHQNEWFISVDCDRMSGMIRVSVSHEGGAQVAKAQSILISSENSLDALALPIGVHQTVQKLIRLMSERDCLLIEINPLVMTSTGVAMALDAKIEIDEAALFRHPEYAKLTCLSPLHRTPTARELEYSALVDGVGYRGTFGHYVELEGDVVLLLSGGGASLVALDALMLAGGKAANYVEMSGNPDPKAVYQATKIACSKPGIRAIWIAGSHANFTDINATVSQMLLAIEELGLRIPVVIRRDGPNTELASATALEWSKRQGIPLKFFDSNTSLEDAAQALMELSKHV